MSQRKTFSGLHCFYKKESLDQNQREGKESISSNPHLHHGALPGELPDRRLLRHRHPGLGPEGGVAPDVGHDDGDGDELRAADDEGGRETGGGDGHGDVRQAEVVGARHWKEITFVTATELCHSWM